MRLNFFIVILISFNFGCTTIVDDLTTEPIQPEETGKTIGAGIDDPKNEDVYRRQHKKSRSRSG